ncbi:MULTISPECIES: energy transducer TonB [unclassified Dysgonomonas]|uniref:energy transducer TonB n=1 Tax=unclassified Dysgonomonas TaxID=2630389 RepID=UPI00068253B2|nr:MULTISPECIES: energy transducer TonB [unclassified Dysgonomonas]MBD8347136.1 energy transducer TonB [Dysgonomonas sp. HGC4]MBF0574889.1 energy transducer TonB [Dysgonomonas sp. GY617]
MGKDINLNSSEWRDIVFEGKNKSYGAYELRSSSSKRHVVAFIVVLVFVGVVAALPAFLDAVKANQQIAGIDDSFELSNIANVEEQVPEENIIRQETAPPPPPLKATIQFTPPVITEDSKVNEDKEMKSIEELNEKKDIQISIATVEGTNDKNAVDIAELKEHKVIVEDKEPEKPFVSVEQMPQFPGGDVELMKFINGGIKYPTIAAENGIEGRVVIRFVVGKDGNVSDVQVVRSLDPSCDKEAVRVVKTMPKWVPGKQNGRNVPVYYTLPVLFKLQK